MRFIQSCSYACAKYLSTQLNENHEKRRIYYYGFQVVFGAIVKGFFLVSISFLFGALIPALIVAAAFGLLRKAAGGYHMDTYSKCIVLSMTLFISAALIARYTYPYWTEWSLIVLIAVVFAISIPVLIKWAPSDTPNRPITKPEEIKKFKRSSIIYMVVWLLLAFLTLHLEIGKYQQYIIAASFGVLQELFAISPIGYRLFSKISKGMDNIKVFSR